MTQSEFVQQIQAEITISGSLPVVLPEAEIIRVVEQTSRFFYDEYQYSVQRQSFVIQKAHFNNSQFTNARTIKLPEEVVSVIEFKEITGVGRLGNIDRDFAEDRLIASEIFLSSFHGDDLVMRTATYQYFDLAKAFFLDRIGYDFNKNTKLLKVTGRTPKFDVFLEAQVKIPSDRLYDDWYFLRYCTAQAKISYARLLGAYQYNLPGGIQVNADMFRSEGEAEIEKILQQIDERNVPDWFMIFHLSPITIVLPSMLLYPPAGILTSLGYMIWKFKEYKLFRKLKNILNFKILKCHL